MLQFFLKNIKKTNMYTYSCQCVVNDSHNDHEHVNNLLRWVHVVTLYRQPFVHVHVLFLESRKKVFVY